MNPNETNSIAGIVLEECETMNEETMKELSNGKGEGEDNE
jgi:hypothetical protein